MTDKPVSTPDTENSSETEDCPKKDAVRNPDSSFVMKRFVLFLVVLVFGLALDLGTKSWVFSQLGQPGEYGLEKYLQGEYSPEEDEIHGVYWIIDDVFGFQTSLNQGALFGMGQGQIILFVVFSFIALTGILLWLFVFRGFANLLLTIVLGMISAGILGNLYDRLGLHRLVWNQFGPSESVGKPVYAVRDWILVMIGDWPWPNFNIADSLIVCGAIFLGIYAFIADEDALWSFPKKDKEEKDK